MSEPAKPKAMRAPDLGYDRWILVDEDTGEILDDAQGYGYKSPSAAHRAYAYKTMPKRKRKSMDSVRKHAKRFWTKHSDLADAITQAALYAYKDGEELTDEDVERIIRESGVDLEGLTLRQLVKNL
ncbi:hypothetical protein [Bifidobacterium felsineum]|uniref:hypothetical protein n=1 Tax=Bifidobacterium felsineum TaxID=2045440 RepID=UPI001BDD6D31|nr:hypothetical protein [Bifidobacterium felsineum]MBT1164627.1 hypothetical protein [Bifidobacterium felsineum]